MNKGILVILITAIGLWTCDTKDNITPLNESFFVKFYAGISEGDQLGEDIIATRDGGLLIAATSENTDGSSEIILIKTDNKGNEEWTYGSSGIGNNIVGKSVIELTDGYVVGGTTSTGPLDRSILIKVDFNGSFMNSIRVFTDSLFNGTNIEVSNTLSKVTLGENGILVSGGTNHFAGKARGVNGFMALFDEVTLETIPKGTGPNTYFGLPGDDIITGAYEVLDTLSYKDPNLPTSTPTHFLAFGSALNPDNTLGYDFFYADFNSDYTPNDDVQNGLRPKQGNQTSTFVTRMGNSDEYWMIGKTEEIGTKMFMTGWLYNSDSWNPRNSGDIDGSTGISGKGITVQNTGNYVIVGDETADTQTEIHLSRVGSDLAIKPPWPKTYGTSSSTYSSSAVISLVDGSIVIVGTADLQPIKKIIVIKTGPNGEMSF